jgi:hypothetical protein
MNRTGMFLFFALLLSAASRQMTASAIQFDNVAGHWLAQVSASTQSGNGTIKTSYVGYDNNYGNILISNTNLGPSTPGGPFPSTAAFMDVSTGNLGVSGEAPGGLGADYSTNAEADFAIAVQFNQAGTVSFSMHEQGFVNASAANPPSDFSYAWMQTSVAVVDKSPVNSTGASSVGTLICISRVNGTYGILCNTPLSVNKDFVATLDVVPGHVYTLSAAEWGISSGYGVFDGIDPASLSLQLSPGLSILPVDGQTLPGFLGGPAQSSVPEPATVGLVLGALALIAGTAKARRTGR